MAATHAQYVAFIETTLNAVSGIGAGAGVVLTRPRDVQNLGDIEDTFTRANSPQIINAWMVTRERVQRVVGGAARSLAHNEEFRLHTYVIRGYYELNDDKASDDTFQALITDVMDAFVPRRVRASTGDALFFEDTQDIAARLIRPLNLSGYLLHYCEIQVVFKERIQSTNYKLT